MTLARLRRILLPGIFCALLLPSNFIFASRATAQSAIPQNYLGFDSNDYPGDDTLPALRRTFSFAGYWLNTPPGAKANPWVGKRLVVQQNGFGFLVLYNGRLERDLRSIPHSRALGAADATAAADGAAKEGFGPGTILFLDQEEGGRMEPDQMAYIIAWIDGVIARGFDAGIYCSGIPASEGKGVFVVTAEDIFEMLGGRAVAFFVYNDACPPAPGCRTGTAPSPQASGVSFAAVWQFAQSPQRKGITKACALTYGRDGNCYAPGAASAGMIDLDAASSRDPSHGRRLPVRGAENISENR